MKCASSVEEIIKYEAWPDVSNLILMGAPQQQEVQVLELD